MIFQKKHKKLRDFVHHQRYIFLDSLISGQDTNLSTFQEMCLCPFATVWSVCCYEMKGKGFKIVELEIPNLRSLELQ